MSILKIILAIVFAVLAIPIAELLKKLNSFRKDLHKRDSSLRTWAKQLWDKKISSDRSKPLTKREISNAVQVEAKDSLNDLENESRELLGVNAKKEIEVPAAVNTVTLPTSKNQYSYTVDDDAGDKTITMFK